MDGFAPADQGEGWLASHPRPLPRILKRYGASRGGSPEDRERGGHRRNGGLIRNESMFHLAGLGASRAKFVPWEAED